MRTFILLGEEAIKHFNDKVWFALEKTILENQNGDIISWYNENDKVSTLLDMLSGWSDFIVLSNDDLIEIDENTKVGIQWKTPQEIVQEQIQIQEQIQSAGFNIVECGNCQETLLHRCGDTFIDCFCGKRMVLSDCPDLFYSGMENNSEFND